MAKGNSPPAEIEVSSSGGGGGGARAVPLERGVSVAGRLLDPGMLQFPVSFGHFQPWMHAP